MEQKMKQIKTFYPGKNVLVTGGAGFIGSHLVELLVDAGAQVTVVDDLSTGNLENLRTVQHQIRFVHGTITDPALCKEVTRGQSHLFHLAAFISVPKSMSDPEHCMSINVTGTKHLLDAAAYHEIRHIVFSSSSAVYGTQEGVCAENSPLAPQSPYAESKLMGEQLCQQIARKQGISVACLRYFNVYGERQNPNGDYAAVVAKFKHNLKHHLPLTIFGDGHQTRDFIHVSKVALANAIMGMYDQLHGEAVNVATGKSITLIELIEMLEQESGYKNVGITFAPPRPGDIVHSAADCSKLIQLCS